MLSGSRMSTGMAFCREGGEQGGGRRRRKREGQGEGGRRRGRGEGEGGEREERYHEGELHEVHCIIHTYILLSEGKSTCIYM